MDTPLAAGAGGVGAMGVDAVGVDGWMNNAGAAAVASSHELTWRRAPIARRAIYPTVRNRTMLDVRPTLSHH